MNRFFFIFLNVALFSLLSSCAITSFRYIDIQVLHPSDTMLPPNTSKLHILDPCKGQNTPDHICIKGLNQTVFDTTLKQKLQESPSFKNIAVAIQKSDEMIEEMKKKPAGRHVLLTAYLTVSIDTSDFVDVNIDNAFTYYGNFIFKYKAKVELSDLKTLRGYDTYQYADSFYWPRQNSQGFLIPRKITDLLAETEMVAAERYANHIAPYWTTDQRMFYYNSSKLMKIALQRFDENDLDGAITLWEEVYKKGNTTLKALAAYNLGLAYEMLDNIDECENWLLKSKQLKRYAPVYNYLNIIRKRKTEHVALDKLLPN